MLKSTVAVGLVFAALACVVPARAADMMCDAAGMSKMHTGVMGMTDASKKEMAMKEMSMAKESMDKKDDKGCMMHMEKIQGMM
jgi:hypothetical protein